MISFFTSLSFTQLLVLAIIFLCVDGYYFIKDRKSGKPYVPLLYLTPILCFATLVYKYSIDHPELGSLNKFADWILPVSLGVFFVGLFAISIVNIRKNNKDIDRSSLIKCLILLAILIILFLIIRFVIPKL